MTQEELIARLVSIYVWIPKSSTTARQKTAEVIQMLGGRVPETYSESPTQ